MREIQEVFYWRKLGLELGLSYTTLRGIERSKSNILDDCKREMKYAWLQGKDNAQRQGGITKKTLVDALERANFKTLALRLDPKRAKGSETALIIPSCRWSEFVVRAE